MTYLRGFNKKIVNWDQVAALEVYDEKYGPVEERWRVRACVLSVDRYIELGKFSSEKRAHRGLSMILKDMLDREQEKAHPPFQVVE